MKIAICEDDASMAELLKNYIKDFLESREITQIPEINSTQIVVEIDLDPNYHGTIRNII